MILNNILGELPTVSDLNHTRVHQPDQQLSYTEDECPVHAGMSGQLKSGQIVERELEDVKEWMRWNGRDGQIGGERGRGGELVENEQGENLKIIAGKLRLLQVSIPVLLIRFHYFAYSESSSSSSSTSSSRFFSSFFFFLLLLSSSSSSSSSLFPAQARSAFLVSFA
uniref:Uncharacterized protein n=2 Tax=Cacopsylla melanoneura TaxID=428564 RepID=A0A8D8VJ99_9HEMI